MIIYVKRNGASPSGKAAGFGPAISEVRILPPQPFKRLSKEGLFFAEGFFESPSHKMILNRFVRTGATIYKT